MRSHQNAITVLLLLIGSSVIAQAQSDQGNQRGRFTWDATLEAFDSSKDGKVTRDEFQGPPQVFARLDQDGDGTMTQEEFEKGMSRRGGRGGDGGAQRRTSQARNAVDIMSRLNPGKHGILETKIRAFDIDSSGPKTFITFGGSPVGAYPEIEYLVSGMKLKAYVARPETTKKGEKRPALIYCHGGAEGVDDQARGVMDFFVGQGYIIVCPTLRGQGGSEGDKDPVGYALGHDVGGLVKWLARQPDVDPNNIFVAGHSMGGLAAWRSASMVEGVRAFICSAPGNIETMFAPGKEFAGRMGGKQPAPPMDIEGITAPIMFINGTHDALVKPEYTLDAVDEIAAIGNAEAVKLLVYQNAPHALPRLEVVTEQWHKDMLAWCERWRSK